jgi:hypothetical protein
MSSKRNGATYRSARRTEWKKFNALRTCGQPKLSWEVFNQSIAAQREQPVVRGVK